MRNSPISTPAASKPANQPATTAATKAVADAVAVVAVVEIAAVKAAVEEAKAVVVVVAQHNLHEAESPEAVDADAPVKDCSCSSTIPISKGQPDVPATASD
jgi:hypothetical protein